MKAPVFLTLAEVVEIHGNQIKLYGGRSGIKDMGLLQSALAQPEGSFAGQWLHDDIFLMAAAYAFHICQNHPFFDGNKRTALASCLVFLELNDISLDDPEGELLGAASKMAQGAMGKQNFAQILKSLAPT
jgi:death-on-curing protein